MAISKNPEIYDFIVVGGGLTGLLVAHSLELSGVKVALLEEGEHFGGSLRPFVVDNELLESSLCAVSSSEDNLALLNWLESCINTEVAGDPIELPPLTFDNGTFKTFVGFGQRQFGAMDVMARYNYNTMIPFRTRPHEWIKSLSETFVGEQFTHSVVTSMSALDIGMEVVINGAKTLVGKKVIFTPAAKVLLETLPEDQISSRVRQKMAKSKLWTSVNLHFLHTEILQEGNALHFLYGSKDEFDPTIGRFFTPRENSTLQASLWMGLLSSDTAEDSEAIANLLREMKKQIKRAYPRFFDTVKAEKIVVSELSHGSVDLGLKSPGVLPELPDLFLADHTQTGFSPLLGSILSARLALEWALALDGVQPTATKDGNLSN